MAQASANRDAGPRPVSLLAGLPDELRDRLAAEAEAVHVTAGDWLFREGEPADAAYLVRSGRLDVVVEHPSEVVIRQLRRGAAVGELGLLRGGTRSTSVRAARDSELLSVRRDDFEALIRDAPGFSLGLIHLMAEQIAANRAPTSAAEPPQTIAVVGLDEGAPTEELAADLEAELRRHGSADRLTFNVGVDRHGFAQLLENAETTNDRVLLVGRADDPDWTGWCVRDADVVIAVTRNGPGRDWFARAAALRDCELICVDTPLTDAMLEAFTPREVQVLRGKTGWDNAITGTARRLAGRSIGLVLSGGGARALAHLGVLDELHASGIHVDRLAGASMGAIVSGIAATGASLDAITTLFEKSMVESNPSNDYTLPAYSLIRGQKTRQVLEDAFGDVRVEELPKRWYSVSCDLISRELVVHRTGLLRDAIYPSMALPGIYPPMPAPGGRLLVDGGVMNNLPVEPMARRGEGPIIAVDVSQRAGPILPSSRPRVERISRRVRRLLAGSETPLPPVRETILRTIALGSTDTVAAAMQHADIVIQPRVEGYGLLDWKNLPQVREAGRQAAREALVPMLAQIESWK